MDVQHTIKGYVRTEEDLGLPGVPVSNGRAVVRTNGDGLYELSCTATDRFILLTLPSGYAPTRRFYIDLHRETQPLPLDPGNPVPMIQRNDCRDCQ